jgi:hypothetical protein
VRVPCRFASLYGFFLAFQGIYRLAVRISQVMPHILSITIHENLWNHINAIFKSIIYRNSQYSHAYMIKFYSRALYPKICIASLITCLALLILFRSGISLFSRICTADFNACRTVSPSRCKFFYFLFSQLKSLN